MARKKPWGPNFLRTGLSLTSDLEGASGFNLLGALTLTELDRLGGELKLQSQLGETPILGLLLRQPIARSRVPFVSAVLSVRQRKQSVPVGDQLVQYRFREVETGLDLGLDLGRYGELRVGLRHARTSSHAFGDRPAETPRFDRTDAGYHASLILDQLDRVNYPRRGLLLTTELYDAESGLGSDDEYRRFDLQTVAAHTLGRHTLVALIHGSSALGGELPAAKRVQLGGCSISRASRRAG